MTRPNIERRCAAPLIMDPETGDWNVNTALNPKAQCALKTVCDKGNQARAACPVVDSETFSPGAEQDGVGVCLATVTTNN